MQKQPPKGFFKKGVMRNFVDPANIYLLKIINKNTRKSCEIFSKLTIKAPEQRVFIVNFENISHLFPVFLLLTLNN